MGRPAAELAVHDGVLLTASLFEIDRPIRSP
jgi:hypothetical protein